VDDAPHIEFAIDWDMVETQVIAHRNAGAIYYSGSSCWWSHHRGHALVNGPSMKCPLGGQIYMEKDWQGWLDAARENPAYYGKHGLRALLAAHHANCRHPGNGGPFAARTWLPYNTALDALQQEEARVG
jgi:hypothetical protein